MNGSYGLWTYNEEPGWLAGNAGCADMMITNGMSLHVATTAAERLAERYPDDTFEVRNGQDETISTFGADNTEHARLHEERRARRTVTSRRPLGNRGV